MKHIILKLLLLTHLFAYSQLPKRPYEKISFKDDAPVWYETCFESSLVDSGFDGYNIFSLSTITVQPIIEEDYMISLHGKFDLTHGGDDGALLQKRDIQDGSVIWSFLYGFTDTNIQEIPFKMYKGEDGYLHIHGYRRSKNAKLDTFPPFLWFPTDSCYLTYRKIDLHTGQLIEFLTPDDEDPGALRVLASLDRSRQYSQIITTKNPDEFIYWRRVITEDLDVATLRFQRVNKHGLAISDPDSIRLRTPTNGYINFHQLNADTFVHVSFNRVDQKITLYYYNPQFQLLDSLDMNSFPGRFRVNTHADIIDNKYIFIQTADITIDHDRYLAAVYDLQGNLLDYYDQKTYEFLSYQTSLDPVRKKLLVMISRINFNPLQYTCSLFKTDGMGGLSEIHRFEPSDSLRTANGLLLYTLNKDKSVIFFNEGSLYIDEFNKVQYDNAARAKSFMVFNATDIGLATVSVKEPSSDIPDVVLFPNPAGEEITVQFSAQVSGRGQILDSQGHVHESFDIENVTEWKIPCSGLSSGLYFFRFFDKVGQSMVRRFVRM